mmetsp:Transcript_30107/g.88059  ORF Transcript_30107/g.88059 Transcript_30107/m.88059 type:complete len:222 (+) Transcript_30107:1205-1870(+)
MRDMIKSFCNAFRSRAFSQELRIQGFYEDYHRTHACQPEIAVEGRPCETCREILMTFPPRSIRMLNRRRSTLNDDLGDMSDICVTPNDYVSILKSRRFEENIFVGEGKEMILNLLEWYRRTFELKRGSFNDDRVIKRLEEEGVEAPTQVLHYDEDSLETISAVVKNGFDPKTLTKEEIYRCMKLSDRTAMLVDDLDQLCIMGLPCDSKDFSTVERVDLAQH